MISKLKVIRTLTHRQLVGFLTPEPGGFSSLFLSRDLFSNPGFLGTKFYLVLSACLRQARLLRLSKKTEESILQETFDIFEASEHRTIYVTFLYEAPKTVLPTSVESERAYSTAGFFVTKLRLRLNDRSVYHFCFLRSFYAIPYTMSSSPYVTYFY